MTGREIVTTGRLPWRARLWRKVFKTLGPGFVPGGRLLRPFVLEWVTCAPADRTSFLIRHFGGADMSRPIPRVLVRVGGIRSAWLLVWDDELQALFEAQWPQEPTPLHPLDTAGCLMQIAGLQGTLPDALRVY